MRNIISLAHISLDGFMAGTSGDMDFIVFNDELADHTYPLIDNVDLAVYGRVTYEMMEGYWPTAGDAPDAGEHKKSHSRWYKEVKKIVASRTLASKNPNVRLVGDDIAGALRAEKQKAGGDIMIFGSPTLTRALAAVDLVDEWRLTLQPVILGDGLPMEGRRTTLCVKVDAPRGMTSAGFVCPFILFVRAGKDPTVHTDIYEHPEYLLFPRFLMGDGERCEAALRSALARIALEIGLGKVPLRTVDRTEALCQALFPFRVVARKLDATAQDATIRAEVKKAFVLV